MKKAISVKKLIISLGLPLSIGSLSGFFAGQMLPARRAVQEPFFSAPSWLFGSVWTTLYLLMGISLYMIWRLHVSRERNMAMVAFLVQLLLNFGWSFLFFSFNMMGLALLEIIALWLSVSFMLVIFYKIKPVATYINVPYLCCVTFAVILNIVYLSSN